MLHKFLQRWLEIILHSNPVHFTCQVTRTSRTKTLIMIMMLVISLCARTFYHHVFEGNVDFSMWCFGLIYATDCIFLTCSSTKTCRYNFLFAKQRWFLHKVRINSSIHLGVYRGGHREVQNLDRWRRVWLCLQGYSKWWPRSGGESAVSDINSGNSRIW